MALYICLYAAYTPFTEKGADSEGGPDLMVRGEVSNGYDSSPWWKGVLLVPVGNKLPFCETTGCLKQKKILSPGTL